MDYERCPYCFCKTLTRIERPLEDGRIHVTLKCTNDKECGSKIDTWVEEKKA